MLSIKQILIGQSFQEICPTDSTNGALVNFEYFNDTLYATGFFSTICNETVGYIAKWENNSWQPSAINIDNPGHALKNINGQLYIAKYVENIDSNWVYVYNGTSIEKVGEGVYLTTASGFSELPSIYDIIEYDGKIVACGEFDRVGQDTISGIISWNGNSWEALGTGLSGNISGTAPVIYPHQMIVHDSELYVIGNFKFAGNQEVNGVAKWDGSQWTALGAGFNGTVYSIAELNNEIIVGGSFTESDGIPINRIAKWNGNNWEALDFGFTESSSNDYIFVHTLKSIDDVFYIAGGIKEITFADNSTMICNGIISYSESSINTFNGGVIGNDIEAIEKVGSQLLIGGGVYGNGYTGITNVGFTSVESMSQTKLMVYPNPFIDYIQISSSQIFTAFKITDINGCVVKSGDYQSSISIDLSEGLYLLQLTNIDGFITTKKIVKL